MIRILSLVLILFAFISISTAQENILPYSTDSTSLTVWNGEQYVPITVKGMNLGVAVPGTFPSELKATKEQYWSWFTKIREAGYNTLRVYTLHYPRFYQVLDSFNRAHAADPLLLFHGVWLEEELAGYNNDLYYIENAFSTEIMDNVNCVHGNNVIAQRPGKAYGTYDTDISQWVLGYIIGREVHPEEVLHTNELYPDRTSFQGVYLSVEDVHASETFIVKMLDLLINYEDENYKTQRPVSFSSWPTLDPLSHPQEPNRFEDTAHIDISKVDHSRAKAGLFVSYHAYPYYPDFMSREPAYQEYYDFMGQNSYLGYLTKMKEFYSGLPLIIAEFGVPSSWGIAHYAQSGMNHGGFSEKEQGELDIRMFQNQIEAGCAGGIQFSWIDEWFKRTWITDPMDYLADRRILWQNMLSAEQNFGIIGFRKTNNDFQTWETFCPTCAVSKMDAKADFAYLNLRLHTPEVFPITDTLWIALDTYNAALGESVLPNGKTVPNRSEFGLMITHYKAELYVTQAYDLFGIWHGTSTPEQLYHSIPTDGAPWQLVRLKNNAPDQEVQFIGSMQVNRLDLPPSSMDAVTITPGYIDIKLPWTMINVLDPSMLRVIHDNRNTATREDTISDGIAATVFYHGQEFTPATRYAWETWNHALNTEEYLKQSYLIIQDRLPLLPGALIAFTDTYQAATGEVFQASELAGLLANDKHFDGGNWQAALSDNVTHGQLFLAPDGSFTYIPENGFTGTDQFTYKLISGNNESQTATVRIEVQGTPQGDGFMAIYPNPASTTTTISSDAVIDEVEVFSSVGLKLFSKAIHAKQGTIDLSNYANGYYIIRSRSGNQTFNGKVILAK